MRTSATLAVFLLAGCSSTPPCNDAGTVGMTGPVTIARGTGRSVQVPLKLFTHPVLVDATGLPQGVTASAVTAAVGDTSANLVLHASSSSPLGETSSEIRVAVCGRASAEPLSVTVKPHGGSFDVPFGTNGRTFIYAGGDGGGLQTAAIDSLGRLVVAGSMGTFLARDMAVTRILPDGSVDPGFGIVGLDFGGIDTVSSVAIQPDGRILLGGSVDFYPTGGQDVGFARLEPDGTLDATFGTAGKVRLDLGDDEVLSAMVLDSQQRIVASGTTTIPSPTERRVFVARLLPDGSPDASYGVTGTTIVSHPQLNGSETAGGMLVDPGGAATIAVSTAQQQAGLLRLRNDGTIEDTFGVSGWALDDDPATEGSLLFRTIARHPDGSIWAVGGDDDFVVARFSDLGEILDGGFELIDAFGSIEQGNSMSIRQDGSVFLVGEHLNAMWYIFEIVDLLPDGSFDTSFGGPEIGGIQLSPLQTDTGGEYANAIVLTGDVLYVAGTRQDASGGDFAIARYFQSVPN